VKKFGSHTRAARLTHEIIRSKVLKRAFARLAAAKKFMPPRSDHQRGAEQHIKQAHTLGVCSTSVGRARGEHSLFSLINSSRSRNAYFTSLAKLVQPRTPSASIRHFTGSHPMASDLNAPRR